MLNNEYEIKKMTKEGNADAMTLLHCTKDEGSPVSETQMTPRVSQDNNEKKKKKTLREALEDEFR